MECEREEEWFLKGVKEGFSVKIRSEQRPDDEKESLMRKPKSGRRAHCGEKQAEASGEISLAEEGTGGSVMR